MRASIGVAAAAVAATLVLASCAAEPQDGGEDGAVDYTACLVSDEAGFGDRSVNRAGAAAMDQAEAELGVSVIMVESTAEADYVTNVENLLSQGCDLVIGQGLALEAAVQAAALKHPETDFALIDSAFADADGNPVELANGKPILFNAHEAAYLAGYVAAGTSRSGTVATFGSVPIPSVTIVMDGFVDGVARYNEETGAGVRVLGWDKAGQTGSFSGERTTRSEGQRLAQGLIDRGADVIMPVTGPVGQDAAAAALRASGGMLVGVGAVGVDAAPQHSSLVVASVLRDVTAAVFETVAGAAAGEFEPSPYVGTLANLGIDLAPGRDLAGQVPAQVSARAAELREAIIAGELVVESVSAG